ncbi:dynein associated protein-domain-containing protein [Gongronella butleri]|nr:dynein associated protein-domain-containing protein [Gongronella butleri]
MTNASPTLDTTEIQVGARVQVQGKVGTIRFVGTTSFQTGKWMGIELDEPLGKNSGVVQGKRYFECRMNHGVFVRPSQVHAMERTQSQESYQSSTSSSPVSRFAPPAPVDTQVRTPSPSSTLLPSRIGSPSARRVGATTSTSRMSPTTGTSRTPLVAPSKSLRRPGSLVPVKPVPSKSVAPAAAAAARQTRSRSGTLGSTATSPAQATSPASPSNRELRQAQLRKLRAATHAMRDVPEDDAPLTNDDALDQENHAPPAADASMLPRSASNHSDLDFAGGMATTDKGSYGVLDSAILHKAEQTVPLKDFEELRLKLKILEYKRHEDRERYREHEKIKEEAEQFLTLRNKLQDKVSELQRELRETQKENKDYKADLEALEAKYTDNIESLEMITLDKEVAEERAENLQQEVNLLKDKMEEINVDLDILRKDADILNQAPGDSSDARTPLEIVQLERHNERLKDALMRLRDAAKDHEADLNRRIKELERDTSELSELRDKQARLTDTLVIVEQQNEELKLRLDDALGAEDMVEQLAEKNLSLTEKIEEMHATIDDLEALKELADELEENHLETEKQLQAEIDHRDMLLREQLDRLRSMEEASVDYEATIQQFRELVLHLQNDLEKLRQKENQQSQQPDLSSQSQAMMSLNLQLQSTVMKAQAKTIDLELRKLDAMQATDKLVYIQPYLPDAFFKTENDAISGFLLFKRLVFKSELIIKHLDQVHPISEMIMDTITESLISVCELRQRAGWLADMGKRFVTFIKQCSPDVFTKMGQVYHDLIGAERRLNGIIDLLRTDELNEIECTVELQRIIAQLEHLSEIYLVPNTASNHADQFFGLTRALDFNADKMIVEFTFVRQLVAKAAHEEGVNVAEGLDRLDYDYLEPLSRLIVQAKSSKIIAKKLLRQLEDLAEQALAPKMDHLHSFKTLYAISSKVSRFCFDVQCSNSPERSHKMVSKCRFFSFFFNFCRRTDKLRDTSRQRLAAKSRFRWPSCNRLCTTRRMRCWRLQRAPCGKALKTLKSLTNELSNALSRLESDNKMDKIATGTAPWIQRASDMKAEIVVDHDKDRKLQQHSDDIMRLLKDLKMKDQALQVEQVKAELLEKRMENVKKQADQIAVLEKELQRSQSQEAMYTEAMDNLQAEYDALEQEHVALKAALAKKEENAADSAHAAATTGGTTANGTTTATIGPGSATSNVKKLADDDAVAIDWTYQIEALKSAIRYLRAENAHLKSQEMARSLQSIEAAAPVSRKTRQNDTSVSTTSPKNEELRGYVVQSRQLLKDLRAAGSQPKVVVLSADHRGGQWQKWAATPASQYHTHQSVLYTLKQRSDALRGKMDQWHAVTTPTKPNTNGNSRALAKIQIPRLPKLSASHQQHSQAIQLPNLQDFQRIHSVFVQ